MPRHFSSKDIEILDLDPPNNPTYTMVRAILDIISLELSPFYPYSMVLTLRIIFSMTSYWEYVAVVLLTDSVSYSEKTE